MRLPRIFERLPWGDPFLVLGTLLVLALTVFFSWPSVPYAWRETFSWYAFDPLLLGFTLAAIHWRPRQDEGPAGRRFWQTATFAIGCWLGGSVVTYWFYPWVEDLRFQMVSEIFFIGYYLALIFAGELRPDLRRNLRPLASDERINLVGAVAFCLALLDYFVFIPTYLDVAEYESLQPSLLLYLGLDLLLGLRFFYLSRSTASPRWCWVYRLFSLALGASAVLVLLELRSLLPASPIPEISGTPWDLLWILPVMPLVVAARVATRRSVGAVPAEPDLWHDEAPWGPVLIYALGLPSIHLVLHHDGSQHEPTLRARETLVILYFLFAGTLALVQYRRRDARRRQAEGQLRESEQRYRQLVESSADALLVEQDGRVVFANPEARRLLGEERLAAQPSLVELGLPMPSIGSYLSRSDAVSPATSPVEHWLVGAAGRELVVEVSYLWITFQGSVACQALVHDTTAVARLRQEAEHMEQLAALGEFAATLAHEIRNPLASLLFNLRLLEAPMSHSDENRRRLEQAERAIDQIQAQVDGVLERLRSRKRS